MMNEEQSSAAGPPIGADESVIRRGPAASDRDPAHSAARTMRRNGERTLAQALFSEHGDWKEVVAGFVGGSALSGIYGVAVALPSGGLDVPRGAILAPLGPLAVCALGFPALFIVLAALGAPLTLHEALRAASRGCASTGLVLAGLAPLVAVYTLAGNGPDAASGAVSFGLLVGGLFGLRHLLASLREALRRADSATRLMANGIQAGFALFAFMVSLRVWSPLLSLSIGGA